MKWNLYDTIKPEEYVSHLFLLTDGTIVAGYLANNPCGPGVHLTQGIIQGYREIIHDERTIYAWITMEIDE